MTSKARGLADLGNAYSDGALSNRNMIINGGMQVAQRGTVTGLNSGTPVYGGADRFNASNSTGGTPAVFSLSQDASAPSGFSRSQRIDCTTATSSLTGTNEIKVNYTVEGYDLISAGLGTTEAKQLTLSFWVKSNQAAVFCLWAYRSYGTARHTGQTYTVNAVDTWEYKSITLSADVLNEVPNDSTRGITLSFVVNAGPDFKSGTALNGGWEQLVNADRYVGLTATIGESLSDYFQVTGVQLEVGDTATPFEHRSYADELARCQRYYWRLSSVSAETLGFQGMTTSTTAAQVTGSFIGTLRATPSVTFSNMAISTYSGTMRNITSYELANSNAQSLRLFLGVATGIGSGTAIFLRGRVGLAAYVSFDAEL